MTLLVPAEGTPQGQPCHRQRYPEATHCGRDAEKSVIQGSQPEKPAGPTTLPVPLPNLEAASVATVGGDYWVPYVISGSHSWPEKEGTGAAGWGDSAGG